jgi:hypothetical protein
MTEEKILSDKTINKYEEHIKTMSNKGITYEKMKNPEETIEILNKGYANNNGDIKKYAIGSIKNFMNAIQWKLKQDEAIDKGVIEKYTEEINKISKTVNQLYGDNIRNEKQERNKIDWKDLIILRDSLQLDGNNKYHLIISIYTYNPPRRISDYFHMRIIKNYKGNPDKNYNYYVYGIKKPYFIFNTYKTSRTYGKIKIPVDHMLIFYIKRHIEKNNLKDNDKLLNYMTSEHQMTQYITRMFMKLIKTPTTIDDIRSSYNIYIINNKELLGLSYNDYVNEAKKMGTSFEMLNKVYYKLSR